MLYHNVHVFARALRFIDCAILAGSAIFTWRLGITSGLWNGGVGAGLALFAACLAVAFFIIAGRAGAYYARRTEHLLVELVSLSGAAICAAGIACLIVEVVSAGLPGPLYGLTTVLGAALLIASRAVLRLSLRLLRRAGRDTRRWLVIGRNRRSELLAREVLSNPHFGIRIARILDFPSPNREDPAERLAPFSESPLSSIPQLQAAGADDVRAALATEVFDEVVVTLPVRSFYDEIDSVMRLCTSAGLSVRFPPQAFEHVDARSAVSTVGAIPMVIHYNGPAGFLSLTLKRILDFTVAALLLAVLLPLFACIALAIKLTSPGPVFFRQQRIGLHGRMFNMLKFRTMVVNADRMQEELARQNEVQWPAFKIRRDPRLTPVGGFLRRYHLDELPQLWNVFVGEMSLVGPRPIPLYAVDEKEWWHRRRHSVLPGLTCLWQIDDNCKQIPFKKWMELDLEYIDRWSFWLDLRVLFSTVRTVIRGGGW